jgi:hypothetical protein
MTPRPTGTVNFVFTDIEGSGHRWETDRAAMSAALARMTHASLTRSFSPEECRQYLHVETCPANVPRPAANP